jgi:hypothetical protein
MTKKQFIFLTLCCLIFGVIVNQLGWAQVQSQVVTTRASQHVDAPPLSETAPLTVEAEGVSPAVDDDLLIMPGRRAEKVVLDSVLQAASSETTLPAMPTLSMQILGEGEGFRDFNVAANVPDSNAAVGPTQIVQFVNDFFAVFNKSNGQVVYGPAAGYTLWRSLGGPCAANPNVDEIVQFDKLANRWVMMMPVFSTPSYFCFAVSKTSDAVTGGWHLYAFEEPENPICHCSMQPDYPKVGVWPDGYYLSYNQGRNGNFEGPAACVVERDRMLNGNSATMQCFNQIAINYGTLVPSDVDGTNPPPAGSPAYFLNFDYVNHHSLDLWRFHVDWSNHANSTFTGPARISVAQFTEACGETLTELNYTTGACIPQAGTGQRLDSYGDRLMYRLSYHNFGGHESLVTNHTVATGTNGGQTGIRWYELRKSGSGFGLYQQGTYAPDAKYRWMGSIAMDKNGDIAMGYSVSSASMSPSIAYTGRLLSDPLGRMEAETDALASADIEHGSRTNNYRWSDYSSIAIDPTDECTFWYTAEYMPTNGGNWSTRLVSFRFPSCR